MTLKQKTVKGLFWSGVTLFSTRGIGFVTNIILSRILFPEDFGIVALFLMVTGIIYLLQESGMAGALIYEKEDTQRAANAVFYLTAANSIVLCAALYICAPYISAFFKTPDLCAVLRFLIFPIFISSLSITPQNMINKTMEFGKTFYPEFISNLCYLIIAIFLASRGFGYFAVVYAFTAQVCVNTVFYFIVSSWRPTMEFDAALCKRMFCYGINLLGTAFIVFISTNIDNAMIGRLIDSVALGYYYLAYNIANITATTFIPVISKVAFSLFCKLNKNTEDLKRGFLKVLEFTMLFIMPITAGLFVFSSHFVRVVLGAKWMPIVVIIQILCWLAVFRALGACSSLVFNAAGKTKLLLVTSVILTALGICLMYPFTKYFGYIGTAYAVIIQTVFGMPVIFYISVKILNVKFSELINVFKAPVIGCVFLIVLGFILKRAVFISLTWYNLIALIVTGAAIYCLAVYITKKEVLDDLKMIFQDLMRKTDAVS